MHYLSKYEKDYGVLEKAMDMVLNRTNYIESVIQKSIEDLKESKVNKGTKEALVDKNAKL